MSEFIVHSVPGSPYGRAVFATLEEKHAEYRLAPITPETAKREPHLSRHPFGRVPVLEHGDLTLYETQAILRYLDRVLPPLALTPSAPQAAALMDQVMNVCDWCLFQGVANVIGFQRIVRPRLLGQPSDEAAIVKAMPKAHAVINVNCRVFWAASTISPAMP
jgi:glutathione S-transferase